MDFEMMQMDYDEQEAMWERMSKKKKKKVF